MIDDMRPRTPHGHQPHRRPLPPLPRRPQHPQPSAAFRPPAAIAAQEEQNEPEHIDMGADLGPQPDKAQEKEKKKRRSLKAWLKSRTKKQWIIIGVIAAVVLVGGGVCTYALFHHSKPAAKPSVIKKKAVVVKPTTEASKLTGLQVDPAVNQRPTTAVMIENSTFARPQSGLNQAGVVFEAVAEGGITRFEAIYQDTQPAYLGPVRSVRPYYIQWALGFDAAIAHVGGSPEALSDMKSWNAKDLDQFANGGSYQRISNRDAPHNVYTSMSSLNDLEAKKGWGAASYTGLLRKPAAASKAPNATALDFNISSSDYNVHYDYDYSANRYRRTLGGSAHMEVDQNGTQVQITPDVVVALTMPQGLEPDDKHTAYGTIGSGHAYIFQDGIVTEGTWHKNTNNENFTFTDNSGKAIALNPGQTWISIVGDNSRVTYK